MKIGSLNISKEIAKVVGTPTAKGIPVGSINGGEIAWIDPPSDGQILIGRTGFLPELGYISAGDGIIVTNGPGAITVASVLGTPTAKGIPVGSSDGGEVTWLDAPEDGQVLIGRSGSIPTLSRITGGSGISVSNGSGTITISSTGGGGGGGSGLSWVALSSNVTASGNTGYYCSSGGSITISLPSAPSFGDAVAVVLDGSTEWVIQSPSGSTIRFGASTTSAGGTLASTGQGDTIRLVCRDANHWAVVHSIGNIIIT